MIKSIYDFYFLDKKVLIRVDFNVPIDENGKITDDNRIHESLPTIDKIIDDGGLPILCSHLGRPKGSRDLKYSLKPVADCLSAKYGYNVIFADDCIGEKAESAIKKAEHGDIVLLENLRFYKEEEKNDPDFSQKLASLADVYVNDAFGSAHRAHASTEGVAKYFKEKFAGTLMLEEIKYLGNAVNNPIRPFLAVMGGAKVSDKIEVLKHLLDKCDSIIIGGGMMFTFFKAMGLEIGKSIVETDKIDLAVEILKLVKEKNVKFLLPVDVVAADSFSNDAKYLTVTKESMPHDYMGLDIGLESQKLFSDEIKKSRTIVWNGPMGVFEMENFAAGTKAIAIAMAEATSLGATTIVGGGDSASAIAQMNFKDKVSHVSTGGGASLEYLEGITLPGIAALEVE